MNIKDKFDLIVKIEEIEDVKGNGTGRFSCKPILAHFGKPFVNKDGDLESKKPNLNLNVNIKKILDWTNIKTMFFDETCVVPRYRLEEFCTKKQVKVVRDKVKADIILIGKKAIESLTSSDYDDIIQRTLLISKLKAKKWKMKLVKELEALTCKYVIFNEYDFQDKLNFTEKESTSCSYDVLDKELSDNITPNTYFESEVLKEMNSQVLDHETFEQLDRLLQGEDSASHKLAANIMTNCDYDKSYVYLGELLRRHYGSIKSTNIGHTVAFRAMKQYLDYNYRNDSSELYHLIENLEERGLFNEENAELVRKFIIQAKNIDLEGENYRIKDIEFCDELKEKIIKKEEKLELVKLV